MGYNTRRSYNLVLEQYYKTDIGSSNKSRYNIIQYGYDRSAFLYEFVENYVKHW